MTCSVRRSRSARGRLLAAPVVAGLAMLTTALVLAARAQEARTIYVSAVGGNGMPVMDLTAAEFQVLEDGATREVTKIDKATEPIYYAILVDTSLGSSGTDQSNTNNLLPHMRNGLAGFVKTVLEAAPDSKIMFVEFGGAAMVRQEFTSTLTELETMVPKLIPKTSEPVLSEALVEAAKRLAKVPSRRRVILSVNREPTPEASRLDGKLVAEEVRKSGASVFGMSVRYGTRQDANREALLKGLAANTGGLRLTLQTPVPLPDYLRSVAYNTIVQYAVTFSRPADASAAKITTVRLTRPGVTPLTVQWSEK